jgi:flagellar biogenesis protein FliO
LFEPILFRIIGEVVFVFLVVRITIIVFAKWAFRRLGEKRSVA